MTGSIRALAGAAACALLAGCQLVCTYDCYASPVPTPAYTTITIIPAAADDHIGTVVVDPDGERTVLDTAYGSARVTNGRGTVAYASSAEKVQKQFQVLLKARPRPPVSLTAYFLTGTDHLSPSSASVVEELRRELSLRANSEVTVIGHTDRSGDMAKNDALAEQRAQRMREQLIAFGIAPDLISVASRGEREPLVRTADGVAEERNRRVEISIR